MEAGGRSPVERREGRGDLCSWQGRSRICNRRTRGKSGRVPRPGRGQNILRQNILMSEASRTLPRPVARCRTLGYETSLPKASKVFPTMAVPAYLGPATAVDGGRPGARGAPCVGLNLLQDDMAHPFKLHNPAGRRYVHIGAEAPRGPPGLLGRLRLGCERVRQCECVVGRRRYGLRATSANSTRPAPRSTSVAGAGSSSLVSVP